MLTGVFPEVCGAPRASTANPSVSLPPALSGRRTFRAFVRELQERIDHDLERGFTDHGPHRDDLVINRSGRLLRTYGSQGQQRLGLLGLLLAEREVIGRQRTRACR